MWDGAKAIPIQEAHARRAAGELDFAIIQKLLADHKEGRSQGRTPLSDAGLGAWDIAFSADDPVLGSEFVRRFVRAFRLTQEQAQKAWEIHRICRGDAVAHLRERRAELEAVASKLAGLSSSSGAEAEQRRVALLEEQRRLRAPVARLFEERLRPQLVALLTPRQKEEAIKEESAKPGSTGIHRILAAADHDRAIRQAESGERPK
ncbi:MAG: hypothetical protein BroJett003_04740 [Planctomycetota bacterium]|nr:MAG: hypothetical protein BroJett003_04740 [Planctomycetota bacterium]